MVSTSIALEHVQEAQTLQKFDKFFPKVSKMAATELVLDAEVDLYKSVDQDLLHDSLAGFIEGGGKETEDGEQEDESNRGICQWKGEKVKES